MPTPVDSLAQQGLIKEAITSYLISRLADGGTNGEITFGGLDQSKFDPSTLITIPNVSQEGFWEGAMDSASVNGVDVNLGSNRTGIFDTGTTNILAPSGDAQAIHAVIPGAKSDGQGGFTMPCTTNATVALSFGGRSFSIEAQDLAEDPVDPNNPTGDCVSSITEDTGGDNGPTQWLVSYTSSTSSVGDVLLTLTFFFLSEAWRYIPQKRVSVDQRQPEHSFTGDSSKFNTAGKPPTPLMRDLFQSLVHTFEYLWLYSKDFALNTCCNVLVVM